MFVLLILICGRIFARWPSDQGVAGSTPASYVSGCSRLLKMETIQDKLFLESVSWDFFTVFQFIDEIIFFSFTTHHFLLRVLFKFSTLPSIYFLPSVSFFVSFFSISDFSHSLCLSIHLNLYPVPFTYSLFLSLLSIWKLISHLLLVHSFFSCFRLSLAFVLDFVRSICLCLCLCEPLISRNYLNPPSIHQTKKEPKCNSMIYFLPKKKNETFKILIRFRRDLKTFNPGACTIKLFDFVI